ncbi:MAG: chromosome partitioning protein ParB, partial [Bacteroidota bacterium]
MAKKPTRRNALGRGLGALLNDSQEGEEVVERKPLRKRGGIGSVSEVSLDQIEVNPFQPRTEFDQ